MLSHAVRHSQGPIPRHVDLRDEEQVARASNVPRWRVTHHNGGLSWLEVDGFLDTAAEPDEGVEEQRPRVWRNGNERGLLQCVRISLRKAISLPSVGIANMI